MAVPLTPSVVRRASLVFVVIQASGVTAAARRDQRHAKHDGEYARRDP